MSDELQISPEPSEDDAAAIFQAVQAVLRREESIARPATWTLAGWTHKRTGVTDLSRWLGPHRTWVLSARLPHGGREFIGLIGRGEAR